MSEFYESASAETAGSAGESGSGQRPEVGESGPAGVAESAPGADKALQEAGDLARKTESAGGAGLQDAGRLAGDAQAAGGDALQWAGDAGGAVEADAGHVLSEAGTVARTAEGDGAKALEDAGTATGKLESSAAGGMEQAMGLVDAAKESGQLSGLDAIAIADAGGGDNPWSGGGWGAEPAAETGESGPAGHQETEGGNLAQAMGLVDAAKESGQLSGLDAIAIADAGNWSNPWSGGGDGGAPPETGESGPAGVSVDVTTEVLESVEVTEEAGETGTDGAAEPAGGGARPASDRSWIPGGEASPDRLERGLPSADLAQKKGRGR